MPVVARSEVARLLRLRVRIPPGHGHLSLVSVVCCQVSSVRRANYLPSVACLNVIVKPR